MDLKVQNRKEVCQFLIKCANAGYSVNAVRGNPPEGATYFDGDPLTQPINVAWECETGAKVDIEYKLVPHE